MQQYKIVAKGPNGRSRGASWHNLDEMRDEVTALSRVLDALVIGESLVITRLPDSNKHPTNDGSAT